MKIVSTDTKGKKALESGLNSTRLKVTPDYYIGSLLHNFLLLFETLKNLNNLSETSLYCIMASTIDLTWRIPTMTPKP